MNAGDGEVYLFPNSSADHLHPHFGGNALNEYILHVQGTSWCKCFITEPAEILMSIRRHQLVMCIKMRAFSVTHGFPFYPLLKKGMFYSHRTESFNHITSLRV